MTTTRKRFDTHSTEFGLWLREQKELDSALGYVATNLDYIWCNYKTGDWMLLEEKRHGAMIKFYQKELFERVDKLCQADSRYRGFHQITFENTNPEDGAILLDGQVITKAELLTFLKFHQA